MIADFMSIIKKPVAAFEKKFGNNLKKGFIYLGIIVGILFLTTFIHQLYRTILGFDGSFYFERLKDFKYFDFILNFLLDNIFYIGSIAAGIFVFAAISKKDFKLIDVVSVIVIALTLSYLVRSCLQILYMFDFILKNDFMSKVHSIIFSIATAYSTILMIIGLHKTYDTKLDDKGFINLVILFGTQIIIYTLLCLSLLPSFSSL